MTESGRMELADTKNHYNKKHEQIPPAKNGGIYFPYYSINYYINYYINF